MFDVDLAADIRYIVQIALWIRDIEVDGWWNQSVFNGDQRGRNACRPASALGMSNLRLQSGHWDLVGVITKRELDRPRLHTVVHLGGSPMQADILNVLRADPSFIERQGVSPRRFVW